MSTCSVMLRLKKKDGELSGTRGSRAKTLKTLGGQSGAIQGGDGTEVWGMDVKWWGGTHNRWGDGTQHVEQEYDDGGKNNTTNTSKI